jgi:hypothetical protein
MVILIGLLALMFVSTVLVIAAGMLSSRLSRQEGWVETYETSESQPADTIPQSYE